MTETNKSDTEARFDTFDIAHAYLAQLGACDSPGGMEYFRVRGEWESYPVGQRPDPIPFIIDRSNLLPSSAHSAYEPGPSPEPWSADGDAFRNAWPPLGVLKDLMSALEREREEREREEREREWAVNGTDE